MQDEPRHQCLIYHGPPSKKIPMLAATIQKKLLEGFRCLYLNSEPMVAGLRSCLSADGVDVLSEIEKRRLVLSSEPVVSNDGEFDVDSMLKQLEDSVHQATQDGCKGLWATGDMTWEFGSEKNLSKLLEYEYKLDDLFNKWPTLSGVCQYHRDTLPPEVLRKGLLTHPGIFVNETLSRVNSLYVPSDCSLEYLSLP